MFTGCEDEQEMFNGPYQVMINGSADVVPESTVKYSIGTINNAESYNWTIESGPAEIVGAANGATVSVKFNNVGEVILSVTNGVDKGRKFIVAGETEATVKATTDTTATGELKALSSGKSDTIFFSFAVPVEGMPSLKLLTENDSTTFNKGNPFLSGSIGPLQKVDDENFYAIYTAGEGNGTPEAILRNIVSKAPYGSIATDSSIVQLFRVDNIAPVATLSYSSEFVKKGSPITITATFSEPVLWGDEAESIFVTLSGAGISERVPLKAKTGTNVYTLVYTPKTTESGQITVGLENIVDFAGNKLNGVSNTSVLSIDNITPVVTGTATDAGNFASIRLLSTEAGTGMFVIMKSGSTKPATPEAFMAASGVASGSIELMAGQAKTMAEALAKGKYVVYFLAMDEAGNYSTIKSDNLEMN